MLVTCKQFCQGLKVLSSVNGLVTGKSFGHGRTIWSHIHVLLFKMAFHSCVTDAFV